MKGLSGKAKVKDDSTYRYRGLTLPIIGIYMVHNNPAYADIYPVGSVEYKLSLVGTEWEHEYSEGNAYTVIHEIHLENIEFEGTVEANVWYNRFKDKFTQGVINDLFNQDGTKTVDEIYDAYLKQANKERKS